MNLRKAGAGLDINLSPAPITHRQNPPLHYQISYFWIIGEVSGLEGAKSLR
jgi:hypothetical protein